MPPVVNPIDNAVLLNNSIAISELFTVTLSDGNPITEYTFTDGGNASSGVFVFQGVVQANGTQLTIAASDLSDLQYLGGPVINDENIQIVAFDGTQASSPVFATVFTARPESVRPIVQIDAVTVLSNESVAASSFISAFDPDGFPITAYTIRDRLVDRSFFSLDGEAITQGEFQIFNADEFARLQYNAVGRRSENIDVFAFDGTINSNFTTQIIQTQANLNRPVVTFASGNTVQDELTALSDFVSFFDADGNTLEYIEFRDRNARSFSGSIVFQGQDLAPLEFHRFTPDELDQVFFRGGERSITEQLRYRVSDGRFRSAVATIELDNIGGGGGGAGFPELAAENFGLNVQEQLFSQDITDLITQVDGGLPGVTFEVIDTNPDPVSSVLLLDDVELPGNTALTFTNEEFDRLQLRTGTFEARFFDEVYVRTNNGSFNSDYTRLNVHTEPEFFEAFTNLDPQGNQIATWVDFIDGSGAGPLQITFSFAQQIPDYAIGEVVDNPFRSTPRLFIPYTDLQRQEARNLFNHIESFANVEFVEVVDSPLTVDPVSGNRGGTIRLANYFRAEAPPPVGNGVMTGGDDSTTCGLVFGPGTGPAAGDIYINIDASIAPFFVTNNMGVPAPSPCQGLDFLNPFDVGPGTFEYATLLDLVATSLGEGFPFDLVGPGDQNPILPADTSIDSFTVQGAFDFFNAPTGFGLYDVAYFQNIYGVNTTFNLGNDTYSIANFTNGSFTRETLFDAGGIDTLSAAGSTIANVVVDLRPGFFSSIGALEGNITIAFGAEFENATGSSNDDQLIGNELANQIIGGDGNDVIRGNGGNDFLNGGAGADTYLFTIADGDNRINEQRLAGRDQLEFTNIPGLDNFELTDDFLFRLDGNDLVVQLALDGSAQTDTTVTIEEQTRGAFQVESLVLGTTVIDLVNLADQATSVNQRFQLGTDATIFGNLVTPV